MDVRDTHVCGLSLRVAGLRSSQIHPELWYTLTTAYMSSSDMGFGHSSSSSRNCCSQGRPGAGGRPLGSARPIPSSAIPETAA